MTSARVAVLAILCLPLALWAQDQRPASSSSDELKVGSSQNPLVRLPKSQPESSPASTVFLAPFPADKMALAMSGSDDDTCYAIRSYVVARDSKDSDSTHLVGYSTCRPAARYQVKTVDSDPVSVGTLDSKRK